MQTNLLDRNRAQIGSVWIKWLAAVVLCRKRNSCLRSCSSKRSVILCLDGIGSPSWHLWSTTIIIVKINHNRLAWLSWFSSWLCRSLRSRSPHIPFGHLLLLWRCIIRKRLPWLSHWPIKLLVNLCLLLLLLLSLHLMLILHHRCLTLRHPRNSTLLECSLLLLIHTLGSLHVWLLILGQHILVKVVDRITAIVRSCLVILNLDLI